MDKEKTVAVLSKMKPADKAKAFDLIVKAYKNEEDLEKEVLKIFDWSTAWFGPED